MLIRTFFAIFLIAVLSEAIVFGAASFARADLHHRALNAARQSLTSGAQAAQAAVATAVAATGSASSWPTPQPMVTCAASRAGGACTMTANITVALATPPPSTGTGCAHGTDCNVYAQRNDAVTESRAYARVTATITDAAGTTIAARTALLAFRVFDQAPYATLAGSLDAAEQSGNGVVSDDAGSSSSATLVHVRYDNLQTGQSSSGDVWSASTQDFAGAASGWGR